MSIPEKLRILADQWEQREKGVHKWYAAREARIGLLLVLAEVERMEQPHPLPREEITEPSL